MMKKHKNDEKIDDNQKQNEFWYCTFIVVVIIFIAMGDQIALHFIKSNPNPNDRVFGGASKEEYKIDFLTELSLEQVMDKINNKESFLLLSSKNDCVVCERLLPDLKKEYEQSQISFYYFNKDLYDNSMTIVQDFIALDENIKNHFAYTPYLMYFEEGTLKSEIIGDNIKNELKTFLENNKIEKN